jgi:hypothetical protein
MGIKKIQGVKTTKQLIRAGTQHKAQTVICRNPKILSLPLNSQYQERVNLKRG